jgi:hypothetical protein
LADQVERREVRLPHWVHCSCAHGYTISPEFNRFAVFDEDGCKVCSFREVESLAGSTST